MREYQEFPYIYSHKYIIPFRLLDVAPVCDVACLAALRSRSIPYEPAFNESALVFIFALHPLNC